MKKNFAIVPKKKHDVQFGRKIEIDTEWKEHNIPELVREFDERLAKIEKEYNELIEEMQWNETVYSAEIRVIPKAGEIYHLYSRQGNKLFLSIIEPSAFHMKENYIASFEYLRSGKWRKIN